MQLLKKVFNLSAERCLKAAGDLFIYHGDYEGALELIEKALSNEPADARSLVLYGDILFCLNRDIEALDAFNMALSLVPKLPEAYISKAGVLEAMGKYREALHCCKEAFDIITTQKKYLLSSLFDQEITLLIRLKQFRKAMQVLDRAGYYIDKDEYDYLFASYKSMLEGFCKQRRQMRAKAEKQYLKVIAGGSKF